MAKAKSVEDVRDGQPKTTSPIRAIRLKCLDCTCGSLKEIEQCPIDRCALHPFRFGKNPFRKPVSEERRAAASQRMKQRQEKLKAGMQDV